jgi:hypothetical protein
LLAVPRGVLAQFTPTGRTASARQPALPPALDSVRTALAKYKDPIAALQDGYLSTVVCADFPTAGKAGETPYPVGAMGVHLLKLPLVGAPLDPRQPQVLIYEPHGDTLQLVGAEWFVPVQASAERPVLWGQPFDGPMDGHAPIMPASLRHWDLHVWLWRANPAGVFTPTNPAVKCPASPIRAVMSETHAH